MNDADLTPFASTSTCLRIQPTRGNGAEESERTVVQRKRFDRKPLVRLADTALEF